MSDIQRIKDLESRLPTVKVSKFSNSWRSLEVQTLSATGMASTETLKYYLKVDNASEYNLAASADGSSPPNVTITKTSPVASVVVRRLRNKVSTVLSTPSVGVYNNTNGYTISALLSKSDVQKNDRITIEFSATNAKTFTHLIAILR